MATNRSLSAAACSHTHVLDDHIQQNKKKKNQNLPEIVYLAIEIKQKIRYDHRQSHL